MKKKVEINNSNMRTLHGHQNIALKTLKKIMGTKKTFPKKLVIYLLVFSPRYSIL